MNYKIYSVFAFGIFVFFFNMTVWSQKVLQIEKYGKAKTEKLYTGDQIYIQTQTDPGNWEFVEILGFHIEDGIIIFDQGSLHYTDIIAIQTLGQKRLGKIVRLTLQNFGLSILAYSVFDLIAGRPYNWDAPKYAGGSIAAGFLSQLLLNQRYHRIGKRKKLRLLDLNFIENPLEDE